MRWWNVPAIISGWLLVLSLAQSPWMKWENTAGQAVERLAQFPTTSSLKLAKNTQTALMFVHPKCECTRNSLRILEQTAHSNPAAKWLVVAWRPAGSNWQPETTLPVYFDESGIETKRFGVTTSGHVFLFDSSGATLFSGGVTDFRGATEAGVGEHLLETALQAHIPAQAAVFGCSFFKHK